MPVSRAVQRQISTNGPATLPYTAVAAAQNAHHALSTSRQPSLTDQDQQQGSWSFFSPDHLPWFRRSKSASSARHPLVKKLISEIYSTSRAPDAHRVWKAYMDIKESYDSNFAGTSSAAASTSLLTQLEPSHLQLLLRAIDPVVASTRRLSRVESKRRQALSERQASVAAGNTPSKLLLVAQKNSKHSSRVFTAQNPVRDYMRKVQIIFRDMRLYSATVPMTSATGESLPCLADYNHVLFRLAPGGHIGPMSSIWNEMSALSSKADSTCFPPNRHTYRELMVGLSRHSTEQIERVQKSEASKTFNYSRRDMEKSARAAASGAARYGQELAPSARAAAILAALRTMALLKDMKDHGVTPNQMTLDFAARTLRLAGHIDGLHLLMQQAYGIDLASPDSANPSRSSLAPSTHTLNTILMTLGEQATVPEMVAAFETLAKPLPVKSAQAEASSSGESLFSTNWKDVFSSMRNRNAEIEQGSTTDESSLPEIFPYSYPHRISPNTETFKILIRHCCAEVDPLRSPVALKTEGQSKSVATLAKEATESALAEMKDGGPRAAEMERRRKGAYIMFAKSLISEALDRSDELLQLTARNFGIDLQHGNQNAAEAGLQTASEEIADTAEARPEHLRMTAVPGRAMDPNFLPILEPPSFSVTASMIEPFLSLASSRKSLGELRWIRSALSRALANKAAEAQVIDTAYLVYNARFAKARQFASVKGPEQQGLDELQDLAPLQVNDQKPAEVFAFLSLLRRQHLLAAKQAQALEQLLYDRLDERVRDLSLRRTRRQMERALGHREERLRVQQQKLEEEEMELQRKKQAAEARRIRALQKEEQSNAENHLEATSTVTA